jgi:hypothetical protein
MNRNHLARPTKRSTAIMVGVVAFFLYCVIYSPQVHPYVIYVAIAIGWCVVLAIHFINRTYSSFPSIVRRLLDSGSDDVER